jgi:hypothetical protein
MEVLIVGCERSGTKMYSQRLGGELDKTFNLENKHTIATFKYKQELNRWKKYETDVSPLMFTSDYEKHTLNTEINIDFLKWVKETYPDVEIHYIVRDGRNVVSSIVNKVWGHSQTGESYRISFEDACVQWNTVINETWDWALANAKIVKYEDMCDIVSTPLNDEQYKQATEILRENLTKTKYL